MKTFHAKAISTAKYALGESPFYDPRTRMFSFVDIIPGKFYCGKDLEAPGCIDFGQQIGAAVPAKNPGSYIVAGTDALFLYDGKEITKVRDMTDVFESYQRSNDAKADPAGRLFLGSSCLDDHEPCGNLYRYDGGILTVMQPDTKISNGMAWNAARTRFFFSDSPFHAIFAYDYDHTTGNITGRTKLFDVNDGSPDGMCIDADDNLWVAVWGGRRIEKHSSVTGELLAIVEVPAENVTSCCFYGDDLDKLFITTSGNDLTGESDGCLFTCEVDSKGCPPDYANL